jgi:hypothetical protein
MRAVDNDRYLPRGIEFQEFRCIGSHETTSKIFTNERNPDLLAQPQHFTHVERIGASEDLQLINWDVR